MSTPSTIVVSNQRPRLVVSTGYGVLPPTGPVFLGQREVTVTPPASASEWVYTLPAGNSYRLLGGRASLAVSGTAGSRFWGLKLFDPSGFSVYAMPSAIAYTTVSSTMTHRYVLSDSPTTGTIASGASGLVPAPNLVIPPGWQLQSDCGPLTGDQFSNIFLLFEVYAAVPAI